MEKTRAVQYPKPSASLVLKRMYRKATLPTGEPVKSNMSMKAFVAGLIQGNDEKLQRLHENWFFNKRTNFSKPPLGIGSTRKKKGKNGSKPVSRVLA